ncbi:hypothetical protein GWK91_12140 [Virgibacillus sp. MSP4-1]|uniref:Uncharacterized protein n=1 Tax=Salinibacillus aidingensis TaxID=237684 RepID=A0ABN1B113_9BACI|nr:hypothetical protein [Virgibacillus sp. MSP4-1]QHS23657.1 hypothetical protein GWK91_12140 [Virgibacillus sp. MSP4-1]
MRLPQAMAYTTIAMQKLGYTRREMESITNTMLEQYEIYGEDEAEQLADQILFEDKH